MRYVLLILLAGFIFLPVHATGQTEFDRYFTTEQLRIDLYHTGTAETEIFSLDEVLKEPRWGGNPRSPIDMSNLGAYLLRIYNIETNNLIFSRGYCTVFGEWATTAEAIVLRKASTATSSAFGRPQTLVAAGAL